MSYNLVSSTSFAISDIQTRTCYALQCATTTQIVLVTISTLLFIRKLRNVMQILSIQSSAPAITLSGSGRILKTGSRYIPKLRRISTDACCAGTSVVRQLSVGRPVGAT